MVVALGLVAENNGEGVMRLQGEPRGVVSPRYEPELGATSSRNTPPPYDYAPDTSGYFSNAMIVGPATYLAYNYVSLVGESTQPRRVSCTGNAHK